MDICTNMEPPTTLTDHSCYYKFLSQLLRVPDFQTCNKYDLHMIALYTSTYRNFPTKVEHHLPNVLHPLKLNIKNNLPI